MKRIVRLTESDLTRIVKKTLVLESQQEVDKIKELNAKYPGQRTAEWCAYAVLDGPDDMGSNKPKCYIKNCLGSTDKFCQSVKNCPSCLSFEFVYAHTRIATCMATCIASGKYNGMKCGVYEGNFTC